MSGGTRTTSDLLAGTWSLLTGQLQAVPRRLLWDNESGIGRGGHLAEGVAAFTGMVATRIVQLRPFDPESKGIVERANKYLETSFLPGRTFASPTDFNDQLTGWLPVANARRVRRIGARPVDLIEDDRDQMHALPTVCPHVGFHAVVRLPRDYYLRVLGNDYSVDPTVIGRMITVHADLHTVAAFCDDVAVGTHQRIWARQQTVTDPTHVVTAARLREAFGGKPFRHTGDEDLVRDLADYDDRFGVDFGGEGVA